MIVGIKHDRGTLSPEMRAMPMLPWFLKVYWRQLRPEVIHEFAFKPTVICRLSAVPIPDQVKAAKGETFEVAGPTEFYQSGRSR